MFDATKIKTFSINIFAFPRLTHVHNMGLFEQTMP
jgi:hypothetical protein